MAFFFIAGILGVFTAYFLLLPLMFGSASPTIKFGILNNATYLATLGVIATLAVGVQVAVRSPTTDDPLEQGRREWLGRFSLLLTVTAASVVLYLLVQVAFPAQDRQRLSGEDLGALFLGFGIACISVDAAVVVEKAAGKLEYRDAWNKLARERVENALDGVPSLSPKSNLRRRATGRLFLWVAPPLVTLLASLLLDTSDRFATFLLFVVGLSISVGWHYSAAYLLRSRQLGNYVDMNMPIVIDVLLGLLSLGTLWFSLMEPGSDVADGVQSASSVSQSKFDAQ